ncbi:MAG: hypothetical protein RL095_3466 [Verrucomicrobiota bacterium]|jgi:branched-chain amino acid transport system permease protein
MRREHLALAGALLFALSLQLGAGQLNDHLAYTLQMMGINIIAAVGLNLIMGHTGQFSLGHAAFMAVGAYAAGFVTNLGFSEIGNQGHFTWNSHAIFFAATLSAGLIAAFVGILVGIPSLRLRGDYLAIVTLGFGQIVSVAFKNFHNHEGVREKFDFIGSSGMSVPGIASLGWIWFWCAVAITLVGCLVNSTWGRAFLAVRDDEIAAESMGVPATRTKVTAFAIGAGLAGIAGSLSGHLTCNVTPESFDFMRSIDIVVIVILGGMGSTAGVIAAAVILTLLPQGLSYLDQFVFKIFPNAPEILHGILGNRLLFYAILLIALMLIRPQGLFGTWDASRLFQRGEKK